MPSLRPTGALLITAFVLLVNPFVQTPRAAERVHQPRHALLLGLGLRGDAVRDDLLLPLTFAGPGLAVLAGYQGDLGPGLLAGRADFGAAYLHDRFGHAGVTAGYGAEVAWTTPAIRGVDWQVSAGATLVLDSRIHYLFSWDNARAYWLGAEYIGPAVRYWGHVRGGWRLEAAASLSVVGLLGRPPEYRYRKQEAVNQVGYYFAEPFSSQRLVGPFGLQAARLLLAVSRASSDDIGLGWSVGMDARIAHTDLPATTIALQATLYVARAWGW